jgi:predicted DNA-binding transcriptional regulator AlpA
VEEKQIVDGVSSQEFMGLKDISELLSMTRKQVYYITKTDKDFPKGISFSPKIKRWRTSEVMSWLDSKQQD